MTVRQIDVWNSRHTILNSLLRPDRLTAAAAAITKKPTPESPFLHTRFCGLSCRMNRLAPPRALPHGLAAIRGARLGRRFVLVVRPCFAACQEGPPLPWRWPGTALPGKTAMASANIGTIRRRLTHPPVRHDTFAARRTLLPAPPDTSGRRLTLSPLRLTLLARKLTHFGRFRPGPCLVCQHPVLGMRP